MTLLPYLIAVALYVLAVRHKKQILHFLQSLPNRKASKDNQEFFIYNIRRGEHYCRENVPEWIEGTQLNVTAYFNESNLYEQPHQNADINKLMGFNEGHPHDSARIGWKVINGQIYVYPYVHYKGKNLGAENPEGFLMPLRTPLLFCIKVIPGSYVFNLNGHWVTLPRNSQEKKFSGWKLYPYFGGDLPAPHNMSFGIKTEII